MNDSDHRQLDIVGPVRTLQIVEESERDALFQG